MLAAATAACSSWAWPAGATPAAPGEGVRWPEVSLLDGTPWGARQTEGRAVVVVFWSINCPFCVRHNAHVSRLAQAAQGKALEVLTVVRERDAHSVKAHMTRHGHRFAVTLDTAPMAAALSWRRITPLTVTVNRQGRLLQVIPGEMFEDDVMDLLSLAA